MKTANEFLDAIRKEISIHKIKENHSEIIHPASQLDDYMKDQYFTLLFSVLIYGSSKNKKALSYLFDISNEANYEIIPEDIVKHVFALDKSKKNDCAVSFRDEEIKYLLGLELYIVFSYMNEQINDNYLKELYCLFEISDSDYNDIKSIFNVINKQDLNLYTVEKYYAHSKILHFYLYKFDFTKERCIVISNCLEEVRQSGYDRSNSNMPIAYFSEAQFLSEFECGTQNYVKKGSSLGHFIVQVGGQVSFNTFVSNFSEKWNKQEELEKRLITPKFKKYDWMLTALDGGYYEDNTYEVCDIIAEKSGVFHFIYNIIGEYNDPFAVISHPLDNDEDIRTYLNEQIRLSRSKKGD